MYLSTRHLTQRPIDEMPPTRADNVARAVYEGARKPWLSRVPWQKLAEDVSSDTTFEEMAADLRQKKFDVEEMERRGWI